MKKSPLPNLSPLLITLRRNQKIILDRDVAKIYRVETKEINQAIKRNLEKFPYTIKKKKQKNK